MEENESSQVYTANNKRVSHTLSAKATLSNTAPKKRPASHIRVGRNDVNHSSNEAARCVAGNSSCSKLSLPVVSNTKERRHPTAHIQSENVKSVCANRSVSIDKYVPRPRFLTNERLDVQGRPVAGLFQPTNSPISQEISASPIQRRIARNDVSTVRTKYGTKSVRMPNKLDSPDPSRERHKDNSLPRRLSHCTSKSDRCNRARKSASGVSGIPRISNKLRKVGSCSSKANHLPRDCLAHLDKSQETSTRKGCYRNKESNSGSRYRRCFIERASECGRATQLCQLCCPSRQAEPPSDTPFLKQTTREPNFDKVRSSVHRSGGNELVDSKLRSVNSDTRTTSNTLFNHRCLRYRMGSTTRQPSDFGRLAARRAEPALQYEGVTSHLESTRDSGCMHVRRVRSDSIRQSLCRSLSSQRRWNQVPIAHGLDAKNLSRPRQASDSFQNLSHSRKVQQSCGLLIQTPPTSGMALDSGVHGYDFCKNGVSRDRPVCIQDGSSTSELRNIRPQRSRCDVSRCVQFGMELSTSLDISPAVSDPPSADAPQQCNRSVSNCGSQVGESILEGRSEIASYCTPLHSDELETVSSRYNDGATASQGSGHDSGNLEVWGWDDKISTWDPNQISLLKSAWRPSTWKTYKAPWKRWVSWSKINKINSMYPKGSDLAQFLADLYLKSKFAYNTILLHKSVISTFCNAELSGKLSEDVLVKHVLKSISLKNPKSPKLPVWDINILTNFMSSYSVDCTNAFQTVRHTAALLILCSGRRLHDLTLLSVDNEHCTIENEFIILWPQFGSKTDCREYRQSGWKLLANPLNQNLNPVFWVNKTIEILNERRGISGSTNLFISLRGSPSPASRTTIAGWFKSLMKAAGIVAAPGSVRAAVASRNWVDNFPIDDILARGNWKTVKTFQKFYRREVMISSTHNNPTITSLFNPVH